VFATGYVAVSEKKIFPLYFAKVNLNLHISSVHLWFGL